MGQAQKSRVENCVIASAAPAQLPALHRLRVVTWNLQSCTRGLSRIATLLKSLNADVVALQEVDRHTHRSGWKDQAELLAQEAGFAYFHFFKAVDWNPGEYGLALLSQWPLSECCSVKLPNRRSLEQRILASAQLVLPGKNFRVCATHLTHAHTSFQLRCAQARSIVQQFLDIGLLLGDMNSLPSSAACQTLSESLVDVFAAVGVGKGGTRAVIPFLNLRIDYIFASRDLVLESSWVTRTSASDHHVLVAEVAVPTFKRECR